MKMSVVLVLNLVSILNTFPFIQCNIYNVNLKKNRTSHSCLLKQDEASKCNFLCVLSADSFFSSVAVWIPQLITKKKKKRQKKNKIERYDLQLERPIIYNVWSVAFQKARQSIFPSNSNKLTVHESISVSVTWLYYTVFPIFLTTLFSDDLKILKS